VEPHPHRALSRSEKAHLRRLVEDVERETGAEIAVLIVSHVPDVEGFATSHFNQLGVGKRAHDNGVLVLVVTQRRVVRIEVGRGLEAVVTPEAARRVIADVMAAQLRAGRHGEAVLRGVEAIGHLIRAGRP
jgi:uncharacterized protein